MKKIITVSLVLLLLLLPGKAAAKALPYLALYGSPKYGDNFAHFAYASPRAEKGGRLVMPVYGNFDNFNPYIFKGIASGEAAGLSTDTLGIVPVDDTTTVYPLIAKAFELPEDKSYAGFILDERARFHDGSPITADDVIFSFKALTENGSPLYKVYYGDVESAEKLGPHHVRFHFKKGRNNKELPLILAQLPVFSAAYWADKDFSKPELKPQLGNGPYKIGKFSPNKYIVLNRVKDYWAADLPSRKGFFNFDEIRLDYYQDTTITLQALFAGNVDLREEYIAKIWKTGYDNDLVKKGVIIKEEFPPRQTATLQNFGFNLRRPQFADKRVRRAIGLAFNFEWANERLFYNQYERLFSYYSNSGMEATGLPQGKELQILNKYRKELPESVFTTAPQNPVHGDYLSTREHLRRAVGLLREAGYDFVDGKMTNLKTGQPLEFEILSNSANGSAFTRVMLPFINNLKKIGIKAVFRNVEVSVFKNRLDNFDFDMAILSFPMSQMPGNEQKEMWGSAAADIRGSFNLLGVKNPVGDKLIDEMVAADDKEDYIAHIKALDRVLLDGCYMIPQWYAPRQRAAYRDKFVHPETDLPVGFQPFTWWIKKDKL